MTTSQIILVGVWLFAAATALSKSVTGWFMIFSWLVAVAASIFLY